MKPILTLIRNAAEEALAADVYGYEKIHFLQFNFDGKGSALVTHDDDPKLDSYCAIDVNQILFGSQDGIRSYLTEAAA